MRLKRTANACVLLALGAGACATAEAPPPAGEAEVAIHTAATQIPSDGQCAHVVATRLDDFSTVEFRGSLTGATMKAPSGNYHVTATAYPQPCATEPAPAPWLADDQVATFNTGSNTLQLNFHKKINVTIDPEFLDGTAQLDVRTGSLVQTSRNGEDIAGQNYSLDGWLVKSIALPPVGGGGAASEAVLFSTQGSPVPYTPRGMGHLPNGNFVFQVSEITQPIWFFSAAGAYLEALPVTYPSGTVQWSNTDGLEAIDDTHLVRTGWVDPAVQCDQPTGCVGSGIEVLTRQPNPAGGGDILVVTQQIFLRAQPSGEPLNTEYALGVTPLQGGGFAVITLPAGGNSRLVLLHADGTLAAPTQIIPGSNEGLMQAGDGRLFAMTYHGVLTAYDAATGQPRAGETYSYVIAPDLALVGSLAWVPGTPGQYLAFTLENRLVYTDGATYVTDVPGIDVSGYVGGSPMDLAGPEVAIENRLPPQDPANGNARIPVVDFFNLTTLAKRSVELAAITLPARSRGLAYVSTTNQLVSHYRHPAGPDDVFDSTAYVHNADGTLHHTIALRPFGFVRILNVNYLPATNELLFGVADTAGNVRMVVTDLAGTPRRSVAVTGAAAAMSDAAVITSGPFAGDLGIAVNQPSELMRAATP